MAAGTVITCPECKKKFKGRAGLEGKAVRCPSCKHGFVVPGGADKGGSAPAAAGSKPAAKAPAAAAKTGGNVGWNEEDENSNPYGVTDLDITPRCPNCAQEMENEKARICLHCGYNTLTREHGTVTKSIAHTGGERFGWLLPGLACLLGIFIFINFDIYFCLYVPEMLDRDSWMVMFDHESIRLWTVIFTLFIMWAMGFFAFRRLILHPVPPEKLKE